MQGGEGDSLEEGVALDGGVAGPGVGGPQPLLGLQHQQAGYQVLHPRVEALGEVVIEALDLLQGSVDHYSGLTVSANMNLLLIIP